MIQPLLSVVHSGSGEAGSGVRGIGLLAMSRPTLSSLLGVFP